MRPLLDYGDIIYGSFCQKIESIQYGTELAIAGTIYVTSQTKLYNE